MLPAVGFCTFAVWQIVAFVRWNACVLLKVFVSRFCVEFIFEHRFRCVPSLPRVSNLLQRMNTGPDACLRCLAYQIYYNGRHLLKEVNEKKWNAWNHILGQWPDMVYLPPPRGNFVDYDFLEAYCLASYLQHVSPLAMEALQSNNPLHMLPIQRHKFNIKRTEVRIHVNICRCSIKSYFI